MLCRSLFLKFRIGGEHKMGETLHLVSTIVLGMSKDKSQKTDVYNKHIVHLDLELPGLITYMGLGRNYKYNIFIHYKVWYY